MWIPCMKNSPYQSQNQNQTRIQKVFHRLYLWASGQLYTPPESQNRVVIYHTSFRMVRKTFEDSRIVKTIIASYHVKVDERDLAMDRNLVEELRRIIPVPCWSREKKKGKLINLKLPRVYVNGKYVGGAEKIRLLHESGRLKTILKGVPVADNGEGRVCIMCSGFKYVLCELCDGSRRVFEAKGGEKRCSECNENGMIDCRYCVTL